ncbi:rab-GTPase-TBC domain-containing protein, partial [Jimgerdemannia flammicorona]
MDLHEARQKWDLIFNDPLLSLTSLRQKAVATNICRTTLRSVCWKVYLTYFPSLETSTWPLILQKERQHYSNLVYKYITNPTEQMAKGGGDLSVNNPLASNDDVRCCHVSVGRGEESYGFLVGRGEPKGHMNPWQQYFADSEIRKVIRQDVERTFPDIDYFRDSRVQQRMVDILFIYCKMNQDVSYRQGMHELLAPVLLVVDQDSVELVEGATDLDPTTDVLLQTLDRAHVEHDAFSLFTQVMKSAKTWYEFNDEVFNSSRQRKQARVYVLFYAAAKLNPVVMECHRIHHEFLRTVDPQLYGHLERLGIEPQLYGIRWLRLLFGREFDMDSLLKLWDGMFAEDATLKIVDYVCLSMLFGIRDDLLQDDYSSCLGLLMHYPTAHVNPHTLIEQAVYLRDHLSQEGGVQIMRQNDVRAGRVPREHGAPPPSPSRHAGEYNHQHHPSIEAGTDNLARMTKPAAEGFAKMTKEVMKSPQVREINKAIAGVMDEVK